MSAIPKYEALAQWVLGGRLAASVVLDWKLDVMLGRNLNAFAKTYTERYGIAWDRSYEMGRFASQYGGLAGFWKVGDEHVKDIKEMEEGGHLDPGKYGLMDLEEFDQLMRSTRRRKRGEARERRLAEAQQSSSSASSSSNSSASSKQ